MDNRITPLEKRKISNTPRTRLLRQNLSRKLNGIAETRVVRRVLSKLLKRVRGENARKLI